MVRSATAAPYLLAVGHHDARGDGGAEGGDVGGGQGVALELRLEARPLPDASQPACIRGGTARSTASAPRGAGSGLCGFGCERRP
jgi:hypothetical protein